MVQGPVGTYQQSRVRPQFRHRRQYDSRERAAIHRCSLVASKCLQKCVDRRPNVVAARKWLHTCRIAGYNHGVGLRVRKRVLDEHFVWLQRPPTTIGAVPLEVEAPSSSRITTLTRVAPACSELSITSVNAEARFR